MSLVTVLALVAAIVGIVLAVKNGEYQGGTFWLLLSLVIVTFVPLLY